MYNLLHKLSCFVGRHKPIQIYDCKGALYYQFRCKHCKQNIMVKK